MKLFYTTFIILFFNFGHTYAQEIEWISFETAIERNKEIPKQILIDVYTDWCGYCKKMDKSTYENPLIVNYISTNFHAVKLNAEQKEDIHYNGKTFKFMPQGRNGVNEFAIALLNGKMSYPSTVFMNEKGEFLNKVPGYLNSKTMEKLLVYLGEKKYLSEEWDAFSQNFKSKL